MCERWWGGVILAVFDVCVPVVSGLHPFILGECVLAQQCAQLRPPAVRRSLSLGGRFLFPPKEEVKWEVISLKKCPSEYLLIKNTTPVSFPSERCGAKRVGKERKRTEDIRYSHISIITS